jgi:hypothetical protein
LALVTSEHRPHAHNQMGHQAARRQIHIAPRLRRVGHRSRGYRSHRQSHRPQNGKDGMNLPRYLLRYLPRSCLAGVCALPHTPYQRSRAGRVACPRWPGSICARKTVRSPRLVFADRNRLEPGRFHCNVARPGCGAGKKSVGFPVRVGSGPIGHTHVLGSWWWCVARGPALDTFAYAGTADLVHLAITRCPITLWV